MTQTHSDQIIAGLKDCINSELMIISDVRGNPKLKWIADGCRESIRRNKELIKQINAKS